MRIYFDNASTTPLLPEVIEEMTNIMKLHYGNPSSIHRHGRHAKIIIEDARKTVAQCLHSSIGEIFFTSCATESNNMVLTKAVEDLHCQRIIYSQIEHHCILHTIDFLQKKYDIETVVIPVNPDGSLKMDVLQNQIKSSDKKTLVSIMHGNNEIGVINDIETIASWCKEYGALMHSDTVQTVGKLPLDFQKVPIDFASGSAHKFFGPKGIGFVYIKGDHKISPLIHGGAQERNMRSGTENIYGIAGLAKALQLSISEMEKRKNHVLEIKNHFINRLKEEFEDVRFNGREDGLYHILSVSFPPSPKADLLMMNLDIAGISASSASACSSGVEIDSHVLSAIGHSSDRKTVRFSFSHFNTIEEVDFTIDKLKSLTPINVMS